MDVNQIPPTYREYVRGAQVMLIVVARTVASRENLQEMADLEPLLMEDPGTDGLVDANEFFRAYARAGLANLADYLWRNRISGEMEPPRGYTWPASLGAFSPTSSDAENLQKSCELMEKALAAYWEEQARDALSPSLPRSGNGDA